jgi:hypothetical protein
MLAGVLWCASCAVKGIESPLYRNQKIYYRCTGKGGIVERKGCGQTPKIVAIDALVDEAMLGLEGFKTVLHRVETDLEDELAVLKLKRRHLDDDSPTYDEDHARLTREMRALQAQIGKGPQFIIEETDMPYAVLWSRLEADERNDWLKAEGFRVYASKNRSDVTKLARILGSRSLSEYRHVSLAFGDGVYVLVECGPSIY